jgi:hypothetical protein
VDGVKCRASSFNTSRVDNICRDPQIDNARLKLHNGDLDETSLLIRLTQQIQLGEICNVDAQSYVAVLFESPEFTAAAVGISREITGEVVEERAIISVISGDTATVLPVCRYIIMINQRYLATPKSKPCWTILPKPRQGSAGFKRSLSETCAKKWCRATWDASSKMLCSNKQSYSVSVEQTQWKLPLLESAI